jgi:hypothetical protein
MKGKMGKDLFQFHSQVKVLLPVFMLKLEFDVLLPGLKTDLPKGTSAI